MAVKASDFLRSILDPLKLNNQEIEAALSASGLKDIEFPDAVKDEFNKGYFTFDRAASNEQVLAKARGAVFTQTEDRIKKAIRGKLKEEDQKEFDEKTKLFDLIDFLPKAMDNLAAAPTEDVKKVQEVWRKKESEYHVQIKTLEDDAKKAAEAKQAEVESIKMDYVLRSKIHGIELAPEYSSDKIKQSLANSNIDFLKKNFVLEFDPKNPSVVNLRKSVDGAIVDVYEYEGKTKDDKKAFTLDDVVNKLYDEFTKKNNTDGGSGKDKDKPAPPKFTPPTDRPLSLSDMHKQAAGATA